MFAQKKIVKEKGQDPEPFEIDVAQVRPTPEGGARVRGVLAASSGDERATRRLWLRLPRRASAALDAVAASPHCLALASCWPPLRRMRHRAPAETRTPTFPCPAGALRPRGQQQ